MRNKEFPLYFAKSLRKKNKLIFMDDYVHGLFQYDWETENVTYLDWFGDVSIPYKHGALTEMTEYMNNIFMFPSWYGCILCYNRITGQKEKIDIPFVDGNEFRIRRVVITDSRAWIFSWDISQGIYMFDMCRKYIEKDIVFSDNVSQYAGKICLGDVVEGGQQFWTALYDTNIILEFNLSAKEVNSMIIEQDNLHIDSLICRDNKIYMTLSDSCDVYEWDQNKNTLKKYINTSPKWEEKIGGGEDYAPYNDMIYLDGEVYVTPCSNKEMLKLNKNTDSLEAVWELAEFERKGSRGIFAGHEIIGNEICFYPFGMKDIYTFNIETKLVQTKSVSIDINKIPIYGDFLTQKWNAGGNNTVTEDRFISVLHIDHQIGKTSADCKNENIGDNIYRTIVYGEG